QEEAEEELLAELDDTSGNQTKWDLETYVAQSCTL
ncbi:unnamed protein product, partial [Rotaria sp. Silwood2]